MFKFKSGVKNCKDSNKLDYKLIADTYKTSYKHTTEHPDNSEEGNHIYLIFNRAVGNFVNINVFLHGVLQVCLYLLDYILENL